MTVENDKFPLDSDGPWLEKNQPGLILLTANNGDVIVKGRLAIYHKLDEHTVNDAYKIRVTFRRLSGYRPVATETEGRLEAVKSRRSLNNVDLHMYTNDSLCLMTPQEMDLAYMPNKSIELLVNRYLVPYFYSQSYFDAHDGSWPWPHHSHNLAGLLEWYRDNHYTPGAAKSTYAAIRKLKGGAAKALLARGMRRDSFSPNNMCLCGSKQSYLRCETDHRCYMKLAQVIRFGV